MKRFVAIFISSFFLLSAAPVFAADVPTSKCVTTKTKATHESVLARMQKDIAPYATNSATASAVKQYENALSTAWTAMQQPYCGFGSYGAASAIKSYGKSNERSRAIFLAQVKNPQKGSVAVSPSPAKPPIVVVPPTKKVVVPVATRIVSFISSGLHIGMRSNDVQAMQKIFASHFKLATDGLVTGYFGSKTEGLVLRFQLEKKIVSSATSPGAGLVGPRTAAALNAM